MPTARELAQEAFQFGQTLDLEGIGYGRATEDPDKWHDNPTRYYKFLAGFAARSGARDILEIGTWYGGSTRCMARGQAAAGSDAPTKIVTIDQEQRNTSAFGEYPTISAIEGNCLDPRTMRAALGLFDYRPVDLLYVDAFIAYAASIAFIGIYSTLFRPRFMILDDIKYNDSMSEMWSDLCRVYGDRALDLDEVDPAIRPKCGFGLVDLRGWYDSPARDA